MTSPRVALVSPGYPPDPGGVERHVGALARELFSLGVDVEVITTGSRRSSASHDGILVHRFPRLAGHTPFPVSPGLGRWLAHHARRFDVIHAHSYHALPALQAAVAARMSGIPLLLTLHYHASGHTRLASALHRLYQPLGRWMVRQPHRILCVSAAERDLVARDFGAQGKTLVTPNGVDLPQPSAAVTRIPSTILAVARLLPYKGVGRVIESMRYLPSEYTLTVVGDGPERERLLHRVRAHGLEDRVNLLGRVGDEELLRLYQTAGVFVSMSEHESFGLTLLEAAAAGAVVVASDIPAHREVAGYISSAPRALVSVDASGRELAAALAAARPATGEVEAALSGLPTWSQMARTVLAAYVEACGQPARTAEGTTIQIAGTAG